MTDKSTPIKRNFDYVYRQHAEHREMVEAQAIVAGLQDATDQGTQWVNTIPYRNPGGDDFYFYESWCMGFYFE